MYQWLKLDQQRSKLELQMDSRILAYLNFNNGNLHKFDPNTDENSFATPRSWEKVS